MSDDLVYRLAEQAGFYVDESGKVWGDPAYDITDQFNKFVELMVNEFGNHVFTNGAVNDEWYMSSLKAHLGVKERSSSDI